MRHEELLPTAEVDAYLGAVDWLALVLGHPEVAAAWTEPSALNRYSVGGVAAHAVYGGVVRTVQYLQEPEPASGSSVTVPAFYGPNRMADPDQDDELFVTLRAGAEKIARRGPDALLAICRNAGAELSVLLPGADAGRAVPVLRVPGGTVPLRGYLRTRLLEIVVHGDDLVASVPGLGLPAPPAPAVEACLALCVELARAQLGDLDALRAFTRSERAAPDGLRVF
ncbi:MAG: maleylpyruvate isomerase N-terminal domain-containing protein [Acidimicrobiales bacterium]